MIEIRALGPAFGAQVIGFEPRLPLDDTTCVLLREAFDERGLLVFRDLDLDHGGQVYLTKMLIRKEGEVDDPTGGRPLSADNWYISNQREGSAAPFGRLQFHADGMWADEPFEVLSLYGSEVAEPAVPTSFVSGVHAWRTLPEDLCTRVRGLRAVHTAGEVRRGDLTDVLSTTVERPPSTIKPLVLPHPRTGASVLYACEQMTKGLVDLDPREGENLLERLFAHLYDPAARVDHQWRARDLVVWDNIAIQHARPNVLSDGPARTLRKVGYPMPLLAPDQMPAYSSAR